MQLFLRTLTAVPMLAWTLTACLALGLDDSREAIAQGKAVSTPNRKQAKTRTPINKPSAADRAVPSKATAASHEIDVSVDQFSTSAILDDVVPIEIEHLNPNCDCHMCNPRGSLACNIPGCGCNPGAPRCGIWVTAEYLLWSFQGSDLPPLVTTSPAGIAPASTGVLGLASTSTLLGGDFGQGFRSGGRISVGLPTDPFREISWQASYLGFGNSGEDFTATSNTTPNLARPVFDTLLGAEASMLIAHSSFLSGSVVVASSTGLQAVDVIRRQRLCSNGNIHYYLLLGYRYGRLDDSLQVNQSSTYFAAQGPILAGTTQSAFDRFETENSFNGFLLGLERRHRWDCWSVGYTAKLSIGSNHSEVLIDGQTVTAVPGGGSSSFVGGLLAQQTNIGSFSQSEWIVIPEFSFELGRQLSQRVRLQCGYHVMYWSSAVRSSDAISRLVSQFPPEPVSGTADPKYAGSSSYFLAHGFQFGLDYRF